MSIGAGIFLSSLLIVVVYLYVNRKGNWGIKHILGTLIVCILLIATLSTLKSWVSSRPRIENEIDGVKLGKTLREIEFEYGPLSKLGSSYYLDYNQTNKPIGIVYKDGKVTELTYLCGGGSGGPVVGGISSDDILKKYGRQTEILCFAGDNITRLYIVKKYLREYVLKTNKVEYITIYANKAVIPVVHEKCN